MKSYTLHSLFSAIAVFFTVELYSNPSLPWTDEHQIIMVQEAKRVLEEQQKNFPNFEYPIACEQCLLDLFPDQKIIIFTYGSLLCKESAARTLSKEALKTFRLAVAFGAIRVFDRDVPLSTRWGPVKKNETGMLNLWKDPDLNKIVNGAIIKVDKKDLHRLIQREQGYDLVPIPVVLWNEALNSGPEHPRIFMAHTFLASKEHRNNSVYTKSPIQPVKGYANMVKDAAASYGTPYLKLWMATTFLSDGATPYAKFK